MTDVANNLVIKTYRDRRKFSLDDKKRLCKVWQDSGLSKHKFCEQNDLVLSALTRWCHKFLPGNISKDTNWVPIVTPDKPSGNI
jgi:transposase-like protein